MKRIFIVCIMALVFISGCATKSKFVYERPAEGLDKGKGSIVAAVARLSDQRRDAVDFDKFYDGNPLKDVQSMLEYELLRTDKFKQITPITDTTGAKADILVEPALNNLQWQVPDYDWLRTKAFLFGFFTGIIGGTIYGYTDTDVYGLSGIHLRITDTASGKVVLDKSYSGRHEQEIIKFKCDTPETRVMVAEKSLQKTMEAIKLDIIQVLNQPNKVVTAGAPTPAIEQEANAGEGSKK